MGLAGAEPPLGVDGGVQRVTRGEFAGGDPDLVGDQARHRALHVQHLGLDGGAGQPAGVAVLAAGLGVERGAVEDHGDDLALAGHRHRALGAEQGQHLGVGLQGVPGAPVGGPVLVQDRAQRGGVHRAAGLAGAGVGAGPLALLAHERGEALAVHLDALLGGHLQGEVDGEAVGVVEEEGLLARERTAALGLDLGDGGVQDGGALAQRRAEGVLLAGRLAGDPLVGLGDLRVAGRHAVAGDRQEFGQGPVLVAELAHRADGAAQDAAQYVAAALVAGGGAVGEQHQGRTDVVGDHAQPHVVLLVVAVTDSGEGGGAVQDGAGLVDLVEVVDALEEGGHPLQAHTGVDVLAGEFAEDRVAGLADALAALVLHEDEVPELHVPVLVDLRAARPPELGPPVVVQLRAGAARARHAHGPEVVLVAARDDALLRKPGDLPPEGARLVVGVVHGDPDPLGVQAVPAVVDGLGGQLPGEPDGVFLEVVAEREVAVHLEERAVPGGLADLFDVQGPHALLHAGRPRPGRRHLTGQVRLEGHHARVDEQQGRVRRRQRRAGDDGVAALGEEVEEAGADLGGTQRGLRGGRWRKGADAVGRRAVRLRSPPRPAPPWRRGAGPRTPAAPTGRSRGPAEPVRRPPVRAGRRRRRSSRRCPCTAAGAVRAG